MFILTRELSELAPAKFKADRSGESTTVKRSLVELARTCRHTQIDWFADWQRYSDVDGQVRGQFDNLFIKRYNEELAGDKDYFFIRVEEEREKNRLNYSKTKAKLLNLSYYPDPHRLEKKYFYGLFDGYDVQLFTVPKNNHQHKEPDMKFHEMTGILYHHDMKKIPKQSSGTSRTINKSVQLAFYSVVNEMKEKGQKWDKIKSEVVKLQKEKKLEYPQDLSTKSNDWLGATYGKLKKKFNVQTIK